MKSRIEAVRQQARGHKADAVLLTALTDIRWAAGFSGSNGLLVVRPDDAHFVSDGRYTTQAREEVRGAEVHTPGYKLYDYIKEKGLFAEDERVVCQADNLSVAQYEKLEETFPKVNWQPVGDLLKQNRAVKAAEEIETMQRAQAITDRVFEEILSLIRPGVTEREIAAEIIYRHMRGGADRMSFDPIVASGSNGAKPHARPSDKVVQHGELLVIDMGCFVDGYASDMTRTVAVGEPNPQAREVYEVVLEAQQAAVAAAKAGMSSKALDKVARDIIEKGGYGEQFSHGLGHGVGLQVHEWPRVSYHTDDALPENAVVTIEPGVYIEGAVGVRIEDMIVLQEEGNKVLTGSPKELVVL